MDTNEVAEATAAHADAEKPRRGSHAVTVAVMIFVLIGFAAFAIDIPYVRTASIEARNAADAGAHAALIEVRRGSSLGAAENRAREVIRMNYVTGHGGDLEPEQITFGSWDYSNETFNHPADHVNAVRIEMQTHVHTVLAPVFGPQYRRLRAAGHSVAALRTRQILIVQDVTGSFKQEIGLAAQADITLLDFMHEANFPADRIGMVTHTGAAEVWTPLQYVEDAYPEIRSQWETLDWCHKLPGEGGHDPAREHMIACSAGGDGTHQGSGIDLAVDQFLDEGDPDALWIIIVLSDGKAQCIPSTSQCDGVRFAAGRAAAERAWDNNIHIFTVSYNETHNPIQTAYLEDLTRGIGVFYETPDASELPQILEDIARTIPVAIVE